MSKDHRKVPESTPPAERGAGRDTSALDAAASMGNAFMQDATDLSAASLPDLGGWFGGDDESGSGGLGWLPGAGGADQANGASDATGSGTPRVLKGGGGYVYKQYPDGTIEIVGGPKNVGRSYPPGHRVNDAVTKEIGPFPKGATPPGEEGADDVAEHGAMDIPWALANGEIEWIQARVDALTDAAKRGEDFSETDKAFLTDLYWWLGAGGYGKGLYEASELQRHYVSGEGEDLEVDSAVYETSAIVQHAMAEMKKHMATDIEASGAVRNGGVLTSMDVLGPQKFEDVAEHGQILPGGILLAEQDNKRLKYANNRFGLKSTTAVKEGFWPWEADRYAETTWRVDDVWDFNSFDEQKKQKRFDVTHIPLGDGVVLELPDGLSEYMTQQGIAAEFKYSAEWTETWTLE